MSAPKCDILILAEGKRNTDRAKATTSSLLLFLWPMYYEKETDPFYKGRPWRAARLEALRRDHYICQDCLAAKARGEVLRPRDAVMVHHILPRETHPELELDLDNLISLCDQCHNKRHPEKGRREAPARPAPPGVRIIKV